MFYDSMRGKSWGMLWGGCGIIAQRVLPAPPRYLVLWPWCRQASLKAQKRRRCTRRCRTLAPGWCPTAIGRRGRGRSRGTWCADDTSRPHRLAWTSPSTGSAERRECRGCNPCTGVQRKHTYTHTHKLVKVPKQVDIGRFCSTYEITYVILALRTQKSVLHAQPGERIWQRLCWYG